MEKENFVIPSQEIGSGKLSMPLLERPTVLNEEIEKRYAHLNINFKLLITRAIDLSIQ